MLKKISCLLGAALMAWNMGCSTQYANIKMDKEVDGVMMSNDSIKGESLGPVKGEHGGAIWDKCDEKASDSVRELARAAKAKGANAVGDIKWTAKGTSEPSCKKGWGYFVLWPFVLTPLFMSTQVTGTAYKTGSAKHGLYMLPNTPAEEAAFIKTILAIN